MPVLLILPHLLHLHIFLGGVQAETAGGANKWFVIQPANATDSGNLPYDKRYLLFVNSNKINVLVSISQSLSWNLSGG